MKTSISKPLGKRHTRRTSPARRAFQLSVCLALLAPVSDTNLLAQYNGSFVDIQPVPGVEHPSAWDYISDISDDELTIWMTSTRSSGRSPRNWDIYQSTRNSVDEPFGAPVLSALSRSGIEDGDATLSSDGLTSFFHSTAPGEVSDRIGIWTATKETVDNEWHEPQFLSGTAGGAHPSLSDDGLTLYFSLSEARGRDRDLYKMERPSLSEPFGGPQPVAELNTGGRQEASPHASSDELAIVYTDANISYSQSKIMIATRPTKDDSFGEPVELDDFGMGSELYGRFNWRPVLSSDWPAHGSKIYYTVSDSGLHSDWEIYEATWSVDQIGDFSADGSLDVDDLNRLTSAIRTGSTHRQYDIDQSGAVDLADRNYWVTDLKSTWIGDADLDGQVTAADLNALALNWRATNVTTWAQGDFTGDGIVNASDLNALALNWQSGIATAASPAAVPEPSSITLMLLGLCALARRYVG